MSTKPNNFGQSITGYGYKQGVIPTNLDKMLERAQGNGELSEAISQFCCQHKPATAPKQALVTKQPPTEKGEPKMTTATQTQKSTELPSAGVWVKKNIDFKPYLTGNKIPRSFIRAQHQKAKEAGLTVSETTIACQIYGIRRKLMNDAKNEHETHATTAAPKPSPKVVSIDSLIETTTNDKKRINAQMEELLLQAQRLEEEVKTKSDFIAFLENLQKMPNADTNLQQILAYAQA